MSTKTAEQMPNDENRLVPGQQVVRPEPAGHEDAMAKDNTSFSSGVVAEDEAGRARMLESMFENMGEARKTEQALINQQFIASPSERRTPHSALLQKKASAELRSSPTLREQVRGILKG